MGKWQPLQQLVLAKLDSYMQENETGFLSIPIHKGKLKMDQNLNISHETIKLLEDNIGKNLLNINMSQLFPERIS